MIENEKILTKFGEQLERNEDIYTLVKCKYGCYKVVGVDIVKDAYVAFTNKRILICVSETIGEHFTHIKYNEIKNIKIKEKRKYIEIQMIKKNGKKECITNIRDDEEFSFLKEIAEVINS